MFSFKEVHKRMDENANAMLLESIRYNFNFLVSESLKKFFPIPGERLKVNYFLYPDQREMLAARFLEAGYVVSFGENGENSCTVEFEAWGTPKQQSINEKLFCSPQEWFQLITKEAAEYIFFSLHTCLSENPVNDYLEDNLCYPVSDRINDFWFRFRIFEHAMKWINATTPFNVKLRDNGNLIQFSRKRLKEDIERAQDKQTAVFFSSVVHVARTSSSMWTDLPLTALEIIIEYVVGKKRPCYIVSGCDVANVNGKYVFCKVVESTNKNYRNVMYVKQALHDGQDPLYLMRARLPKKGLVWGITQMDDAKEFKQPEQALRWSKMVIADGNWCVGETGAPDHNISIEVAYD